MALEDHGTGPYHGPPPKRRVHKPSDPVTEMHGNGMPWAISMAQQNVIVESIAKGCSLRGACARAGVPYTTFEDWMRRGGDVLSDSKLVVPLHLAVDPYKSFALRVREVGAEAEMKAANYIMEHRDWKAKAWYLTRRHSRSWKADPEAGADSQKSAEDAVSVNVYVPDNGRSIE